MIYTISYGIVLFCIAWKHIMLYDIEIWYHVIFCCRLQNAILNHIMLIHIMAKKCTIIQYCSRLYCNKNHINMFINCTPIHHTMIWYNVISHYVYLQCAVLWLQCIPLCHMHLKLSKLHSNTLEKNCTMYCHTTRTVFGKRLDQNEPSINSITINLTLVIFNNPSVNKWTINMNNRHESMIFSVKGTSPGGSVHAWSCRGHTANIGKPHLALNTESLRHPKTISIYNMVQLYNAFLRVNNCTNCTLWYEKRAK